MASIKIVSLLALLAAAKCNPIFDETIQVPSECAGKSLCDVLPENYPQDAFNDYIAAMREKAFISSVQYDGELPEKITYDDENCSIREVISQPFIFSKLNGTAKFVVQSRYFEQKIKQTECLNKDRKCFTEIHKDGFEAKCTPTYGTVKLYVYDPVSKAFEHEDAIIPVCCTCSMTMF